MLWGLTALISFGCLNCAGFCGGYFQPFVGRILLPQRVTAPGYVTHIVIASLQEGSRSRNGNQLVRGVRGGGGGNFVEAEFS